MGFSGRQVPLVVLLDGHEVQNGSQRKCQKKNLKPKKATEADDSRVESSASFPARDRASSTTCGLGALGIQTLGSYVRSTEYSLVLGQTVRKRDRDGETWA